MEPGSEFHQREWRLVEEIRSPNDLVPHARDRHLLLGSQPQVTVLEQEAIPCSWA